MGIVLLDLILFNPGEVTGFLQQKMHMKIVSTQSMQEIQFYKIL